MSNLPNWLEDKRAGCPGGAQSLVDFYDTALLAGAQAAIVELCRLYREDERTYDYLYEWIESQNVNDILSLLGMEGKDERKNNNTQRD